MMTKDGRPKVLDFGLAKETRASNPDVPADLTRLIRRCLEKDPQRRLQTALDVGNELREMAHVAPQNSPLTAARSTPSPDSGAARADEGFWVAVLPFKDAGAHADIAGLAEGLSEEIVTGLSRFSYLRVIARASGKHTGARADCWALLSLQYSTEFHSDFNARPDSLGRALDAARRAVDAGPSSQTAHWALVEALFFRSEMAAFRAAAERAVALNPLDSSTMAFIGLLMAYAGDWQRGGLLVERAAQLNPSHPDWYWFGPFYDFFRQGRYQAALDVAADA